MTFQLLPSLFRNFSPGLPAAWQGMWPTCLVRSASGECVHGKAVRGWRRKRERVGKLAVSADAESVSSLLRDDCCTSYCSACPAPRLGGQIQSERRRKLDEK